MPTLARLAIRAALLYLVVALLLLAVPMVGFGGRPWLRALAPSAVHLLTVGWLTQLILAVAFWMFPKQSRERPRGNERLMAAALLMLNGGLLLRLLFEPWQTLNPGALAAGAVGAAALLQSAAAIAAAVALWPRVRGK